MILARFPSMIPEIFNGKVIFSRSEDEECQPRPSKKPASNLVMKPMKVSKPRKAI